MRGLRGSTHVLVAAVWLVLFVPASGAQATSTVTSITLTPGTTTFPAPIGITYSEPLQRLILSVNYSGGANPGSDLPGNFATVAPDGSFSPFTDVSGVGGEVYPTAIRTSSCEGGFTPGDVYFYDGNQAIAKISNGVVTDSWAALPDSGQAGMTQDAACVVGGDLVVTFDDGDVWRVSSAGVATEVATGVGSSMEGPITVPNKPRYGPWAGKILVTDESAGCVDSIDPADPTHPGSVCKWGGSPGAEGVAIVPANENLFAVDYGGNGTLDQASASQFTGVVGDVMVYTELPGGLWDVKWNPETQDFDTYDMLAPPGSGDATQFEGVAFAPAGLLGVTTTKTADEASVAPGSSDGYTITISNPGSSDVPLTDVTDTLPAGFAYTSGSSSGVTTSDPTVSDQTLTWTGSFSVPANGSVSLHFMVTVPSTPGTYYNNAGADSSSATVTPTGPTAPVTITALRTTSTAVSCQPSEVVVGSASSCTATVTDTDSGTATTPTGSVSFGSASGTFDQGSCALVEAAPGVASCSVSYTPTSAGTHAVTGSYGGDATHATSHGDGSVQALAPSSCSSTWCIVPSTDGARNDSGLYAVSCPSTTVCEAVGGSWTYSNREPLIERWHGGAWSDQKVGRFSGVLQGVSCWSASECFAVGINGLYQVIERYQHGAWSEDKSAPHVLGQEPAAVSCPQAGWCMAVGFHKGPFAEEWDGTGWHAIPIAKAQGTLYGVSCTSRSECVAVGEDPNGTNPTVTLVERWNGKTWKHEDTPNANRDHAANELYGVGCVSADDCTAVGQAGSDPIAEHWNGKAWKLDWLKPPAARKGTLRAVSCPDAGACTAVGYTAGLPYAEPLAERQGWTQQSVEKPAGNHGALLGPQAAGTIFSGAAVSCPSSNWCMAVGKWSSPKGDRSHTLAERYDKH